jgi:hypothetical protein
MKTSIKKYENFTRNQRGSSRESHIKFGSQGTQKYRIQHFILNFPRFQKISLILNASVFTTISLPRYLLRWIFFIEFLTAISIEFNTFLCNFPPTNRKINFYFYFLICQRKPMKYLEWMQQVQNLKVFLKVNLLFL